MLALLNFVDNKPAGDVEAPCWRDRQTIPLRLNGISVAHKKKRSNMGRTNHSAKDKPVLIEMYDMDSVASTSSSVTDEAIDRQVDFADLVAVKRDEKCCHCVIL